MYNDSNFTTHPLAVLKPVKEPRLYTLAEYLQREERSKDRHEYYNGIITKRTMAKGPHNIIVASMTTTLNNALDATGKEYSVFGSQQLVYFPELNFSVYPDVLAVAETPKYWDKNEVLLINPLLIIEVLSRSTRTYDRTDKFKEYKTLPSFQEYLLIDPDKCHIETHFREEPDLWRDKAYKNMDDVISLKSVGCTIDVRSIYKKITFKK
jgi:Uma2 family endonuclease